MAFLLYDLGKFVCTVDTKATGIVRRFYYPDVPGSIDLPVLCQHRLQSLVESYYLELFVCAEFLVFWKPIRDQLGVKLNEIIGHLLIGLLQVAATPFSFGSQVKRFILTLELVEDLFREVIGRSYTIYTGKTLDI